MTNTNCLIVPEPIQTRAHYDESSDKLIIERIQDVEPILESNKRAMNNACAGWKGEFHRVASIPLVIIEKYKNEKGIDLMNDKEALNSFLNDRDNRCFRTKPGKI
jgi:hypothetical protein